MYVCSYLQLHVNAKGLCHGLKSDTNSKCQQNNLYLAHHCCATFYLMHSKSILPLAQKKIITYTTCQCYRCSDVSI